MLSFESAFLPVFPSWFVSGVNMSKARIFPSLVRASSSSVAGTISGELRVEEDGESISSRRILIWCIRQWIEVWKFLFDKDYIPLSLW
jgi:hypothetical protein